MGIYHFYISLRADMSVLDALNNEYKNNALYQKAFYFGLTDEYNREEYPAGISSVIDNFLPATHLIYNFLAKHIHDNLSINAGTGPASERVFDFRSKSEFVKYMYDAYESKIDTAYEKMGTMLIDQNKYIQIRKRLYRKHYYKITNCRDNHADRSANQ